MHPDRTAALIRIGLGTAAAFTLLVALAPNMIQDPFIRSDDYSVVLGEPDRYWLKTLQEGRWLNWLWSLRPAIYEPVTHMVLFLLTWSVTSGSAAWLLFRDDALPWRTVVFALALAVTPSIADFAGWPATSVMFTATLAGYALIAALTNERVATRALWLFVPLGLMAYPTGPFAMLLLRALAFRGPVPLGRSIRLLAIFVAAYGLGVLLIFTLNWLAHGNFGIEVARWREPHPVEDLQSLMSNMAVGIQWLVAAFREMGFLHPAWTVLVIALFALSLAGTGDGRGRVLVLCLFLILTIGFAIVVRNGIVTPFRSSFFVYMAIVFAFGLAAERALGVGRWGWCLAAVAVALPGTMIWILTQAPLAGAQAESRRMAAELASAAQRAGLDPAGRVYIVGDPLATPAGRVAHGPERLGYRLFRLLRRPVRVCLAGEAGCEAAFAASASAPVWPEVGSVRVLSDGGLLLNLPPTPPGAERFPPWTTEWTLEAGGIGRKWGGAE